jgi:hypothetical protein
MTSIKITENDWAAVEAATNKGSWGKDIYAIPNYAAEADKALSFIDSQRNMLYLPHLTSGDYADSIISQPFPLLYVTIDGQIRVLGSPHLSPAAFPGMYIASCGDRLKNYPPDWKQFKKVRRKPCSA